MSGISAGISLDGTTSTSLSTLEISPIPQSPIEESDRVALISASPIDTDAQTSVKYLPNNEVSSNPTMVVVTSPSFSSDLSSEQNETIDEINPSSLSFLQTKQHRALHRRNKSEPVKSLSIDDIPSTITTLELSLPNTTNDESPLSNNSLNENKRKSSIKTLSNNTSPVISIKQITQEKSSSSSTTSTRKKKPWYNVSIPCFYD